MTKNRYTITVLHRNYDREVIGSCIAYDIEHAINLFKDRNIIVYTVPSREQVNANLEIGIEVISTANRKKEAVVISESIKGYFKLKDILDIPGIVSH